MTAGSLSCSRVERHECRHPVGDLCSDEDPGVAFHLDRPRRDVELAELVEVVDRLGRQSESVARSELRDAFTEALSFTDFGA